MSQFNETRLSRALAKILRHSAEKEGLPIRPDGYVRVADLLQHNQFKTIQATFEQIRHVVATNDKQRFQLLLDDQGEWSIRATQGHSIERVDGIDYTRILSPGQLPQVVHGTNPDAWERIRTTGLKPMSRTFIHLSTGKFGEPDVVSGVRANATVYIIIDVARAMEDGVQFFRSHNGVILTKGIAGVLSQKYFARIENRQGERID